MTSFSQRLLDSLPQPAVRLSTSGRILGWNRAADCCVAGLTKRKAIAPLLHEELRTAVATALASNADSIDVPSGRVLRVSARERLLLLDAPQASAFDELPIPILVWEHDGNLASAHDLRLVAANRAAEEIGPKQKMRELVGRKRGEIGPIGALDAVYLQVVRSGKAAIVRDLDDQHGNTFNANIFPLGASRVGVAFESAMATVRAERGYRTIFERSHDAIVLIDPDTEVILEANPAAVELYGRPSLEGVTMAQLSKHYRPGMSPRILAHGFLRFETTHVRGDGHDLHLDANTTIIDYNGRPVILGMMRDITAQIEARDALLASEEKYRSLVANAPVIIWTLDVHDSVSFISASAELVTGFTPAEMIPGFWAARVHEDDRARFVAAQAASFAQRVPLDVEYRFQRKDGTWAWFQDRTSRIYDNDGVPTAEGVTIDIDARKRAELELVRRQAQLAEAQSITHIGSMEIDLDTGQVDWSDEMFRIAGLEPQSRRVTLELVSELVPAEVIARVTEQLIEQEHVMYRVDGKARTVLSRARLVIDATGRRRIVGTVQDVSEKRAAELALREHERRLQLIVSRLPVLLWSTDAELRLNSLTGAGFEQSRPQTMSLLSLTVHDLLGAMPGEEEELRPALQGHSVTFDTVHGDRDLRVYIEPLRDEQGTVTGTVGIAFDRTDEKRAERANAQLLEQLHDAAEEWRETFDSIHAPIVITDSTLSICRMNAAALAQSRFTEYRDAIGKPAAEVGETSIWKDIDAISRAASSHRSGISLQGVDHDGRHWDLLASPARHDQVIVIATEVTELVRMQERLRRTERMSEMGALVAGVAHEVRNPLFGISATLDAFEARFGAEQFSGYVTALREQVDRMSQLMHDLLEYGRPLAATFERACVSGVVVSAIASTNALARQQEVRIDNRMPAEVAKVAMDRPRMLQVFENLITNAIQHAPAGTAVEISCVADADAVGILVEDRGPGFREGDLARVFEPFFTRRRNGTGLGLSLVRRIVEEHNGSVLATNRDGGGAAVLVSLPVAGENA